MKLFFDCFLCCAACGNAILHVSRALPRSEIQFQVWYLGSRLCHFWTAYTKENIWCHSKLYYPHLVLPNGITRLRESNSFFPQFLISPTEISCWQKKKKKKYAGGLSAVLLKCYIPNLSLCTEIILYIVLEFIDYSFEFGSRIHCVMLQFGYAISFLMLQLRFSFKAKADYITLIKVFLYFL